MTLNGRHLRSLPGSAAPAAATAGAASVPMPVLASAAPHKCACKKLRPYRRIHSLAGVLFGAFLVIHLLIAASALRPAQFAANAAVVRGLPDRFPALELAGIGIPLLVLVALGVHLLFEAGLNPARERCKRGGRIRYFLQRLSAAIILAFIAFHVATVSRWGLRGGSYDPSRPFVSVASALRTNAAVEAFYLLAIAALSYHLANGLWTGAIAWGAIRSDRAKRNWEALCAAFGVALCSTGMVALYAFLHVARNT